MFLFGLGFAIISLISLVRELLRAPEAYEGQNRLIIVGPEVSEQAQAQASSRPRRSVVSPA